WFFFSSRRRHTRFSRDWSSDVCSSDLIVMSGIVEARGTFSGGTWSSAIEAMGRPGEVAARIGLPPDASRAVHGRKSGLRRDDERSEERRVGKERRWGWRRAVQQNIDMD